MPQNIWDICKGRYDVGCMEDLQLIGLLGRSTGGCCISHAEMAASRMTFPIRDMVSKVKGPDTDITPHHTDMRSDPIKAVISFFKYSPLSRHQ